ncbi:MAG: ABC transporter permease [Capsulimonadales bacterium]|nr:ABC transporter permease [Capsulimonadales bacterium]
MATAAPLMPSPSRSRVHRTILPGRGFAALRLGDLWEYRDLWLTLSGRDIRLRYRQTALGAIWVLLQPLTGAAILTFVFGQVAGLASTRSDVPYFVPVLIGQVGWALFAGTLTKMANSLVQNAALISKVFFPRLVLPLSTIGSSLIDLGVGVAVIAVLVTVLGVPGRLAGLSLLSLPVWIALLLLLSSGIGLMAAAVMVRYRDVIQILPVIVQFLLLGSPTGWMLSDLRRHVPDSLQTTYFLLNPVAVLIEGFRWSWLGGDLPWGWAGYSAGVSVVVFLVGVFVFRQQERSFADVI